MRIGELGIERDGLACIVFSTPIHSSASVGFHRFGGQFASRRDGIALSIVLRITGFDRFVEFACS